MREHQGGPLMFSATDTGAPQKYVIKKKKKLSIEPTNLAGIAMTDHSGAKITLWQ